MSGLHSGQTASDGIHVVQAFEVADAAARAALLPTASTNVGKIIRQLDDDTFWLITDTSTAVQLGAAGIPPVFGSDYQYSASEPRSTTTSNVFQTKVTLTTPTLNGIYRIGWTAVVDQSNGGDEVESRLFDVTNGVTLGIQSDHEPKDVNNRIHVGEFFQLQFVNESRQMAIEWREQRGSTAGIQGARIEIWRVV